LETCQEENFGWDESGLVGHFGIGLRMTVVLAGNCFQAFLMEFWKCFWIERKGFRLMELRMGLMCLFYFKKILNWNKANSVADSEKRTYGMNMVVFWIVKVVKVFFFFSFSFVLI
jgi:hypothetical protein